MAGKSIGVSIAGELEEEVNKEARATALNILRGVVKATPIDTGRAKGNWFVGMNSPNRSIENDRRQSQAITEGVSEIEKAKNIEYPTIIVSNNLPYMQRLNDGYSTQAPKKFVETVVNRVSRQ